MLFPPFLVVPKCLQPFHGTGTSKANEKVGLVFLSLLQSVPPLLSLGCGICISKMFSKKRRPAELGCLFLSFASTDHFLCSLSFVVAFSDPFSFQRFNCPKSYTFTNARLQGGLRAGQFRRLGPPDDTELCIQRCCDRRSCDLVTWIGEHCFSVSCVNRDMCKPIRLPSNHRGMRLMYIASRQHTIDEGVNYFSFWEFFRTYTDSMQPSFEEFEEMAHLLYFQRRASLWAWCVTWPFISGRAWHLDNFFGSWSRSCVHLLYCMPTSSHISFEHRSEFLLLHLFFLLSAKMLICMALYSFTRTSY